MLAWGGEGAIGPPLNKKLFPVNRPRWDYFTALPGRIFVVVVVVVIKIFQPFFVRFSNGFHHCIQNDP